MSLGATYSAVGQLSSCTHHREYLDTVLRLSNPRCQVIHLTAGWICRLHPRPATQNGPRSPPCESRATNRTPSFLFLVPFVQGKILHGFTKELHDCITSTQHGINTTMKLKLKILDRSCVKKSHFADCWRLN